MRHFKKKVVRGNQAPFVNKEMRKAIYTRSRLKNNFWKKSTLDNGRLYKNRRHKCISLRKKYIKTYF